MSRKLFVVVFFTIIALSLAEEPEAEASASAPAESEAPDKTAVETPKSKREGDDDDRFEIHPVFAPHTRAQEGLNHALINAVKSRDLEGTRFLIASGANTSATTENGATCLHLASERGFIRVVRELIKRDQSLVNRPKDDLATPLHQAALHCQIPVVQLLLDNGALINARDVYGATPLHCAAFHDDSLLGRLLLSRGANPTSLDKHDATALHIAAYVGNKRMTTVLVTEGVPVNAKNKEGSTALHEASYYGHGHTVRELLMLGAENGIANLAGKKPKDLWCACQHAPTMICEKSCLPGYDESEDAEATPQ